MARKSTGRRKPYSKYHVDLSVEGKKARTVKDYKTGKEVTFDSLLELQFYEDNIVPGMQNGDIEDYEMQKSYILQPSFVDWTGKRQRAITYLSDFTVFYKDGTEKAFDVKGGLIDPLATLKKKLMLCKYPEVKFEWVTYLATAGWINYDDYKELKKAKKKGRK